jgi:quercetin dioxygenase-like cupin family protein
MKRITQDLVHALPSHSPVFVGEVATQNLITDLDSGQLRVTSVTFRDGARNRMHRHSSDQVLIATHGRGIVATEEEELRLEPGDVVLIPAGECHWHGAEAGSDFTLLAITAPNEMTIDEPAEESAVVYSAPVMAAR